MFSKIKLYTGVFLICSVVFLSSCGKVVQQTTADLDNKNFFDLTYKTDQIYFSLTEIPLSKLVSSNRITLPELKGFNLKQFSNNDGWLNSYYKNKQKVEVIIKDELYHSELIDKKYVDFDSQDVSIDSYIFDNSKPIYSLIRGYKKDKVYELAWGYCLFEKDLSTTQLKPNNPLKVAVNKKYLYKPVFYDKEKIKVTDSKKSQISGKFNASSLELDLNTKYVSRDYDYYLVTLYSTEDSFQMKVFSNKFVSKNKVLDLNLITPLDTFRSLIYIEAFRNDSVDLAMYNGLNQLFGQEFFNSLDYEFSSFDLKLFNKKRPQFKYLDSAIQEYVFILELAFIDINEAITYVTQNEKKLLTKDQQKLLIDSIKLLKSANVE